jgi:hypothetical protein
VTVEEFLAEFRNVAPRFEWRMSPASGSLRANNQIGTWPYCPIEALYFAKHGVLREWSDAAERMLLDRSTDITRAADSRVPGNPELRKIRRRLMEATRKYRVPLDMEEECS